jgi:hypothetical protein
MPWSDEGDTCLQLERSRSRRPLRPLRNQRCDWEEGEGAWADAWAAASAGESPRVAATAAEQEAAAAEEGAAALGGAGCESSISSDAEASSWLAMG